MALILSPPESQETLPERLSGLGRNRKIVALATGSFTCIASLLCFIAVACSLDALFHLSSLTRGFELVFLLLIGGVLWVQGVSRPMAYRTEPLFVALELEDRYPTLNDALASAVAFLAEDADERGVSNRLQKISVRSAERLVDRHEFGELIPSGACWRAAWFFAIVVAAIIPLVLVNSNLVFKALIRLADPFGSHPWPTKTRVEILSPEKIPARVPKGDPFVLKFAVRGVIKDRAVVAFRLNSGEEFEEQLPLTGDTDSRGSAIVTTQLDPGRLPSSFSFRVIANDYDTGWQYVEVVPPPRLVDFAGRSTPQFHVTPPAYTGLLAFDLPDGAGVLEDRKSVV